MDVFCGGLVSYDYLSAHATTLCNIGNHDQIAMFFSGF